MCGWSPRDHRCKASRAKPNDASGEVCQAAKAEELPRCLETNHRGGWIGAGMPQCPLFVAVRRILFLRVSFSLAAWRKTEGNLTAAVRTPDG